MNITKIKTTYKVTRGDEKAQIEVYDDGRIETLNIRLLKKSDLIEKAIEQMKPPKINDHEIKLCSDEGTSYIQFGSDVLNSELIYCLCHSGLNSVTLDNGTCVSINKLKEVSNWIKNQ